MSLGLVIASITRLPTSEIAERSAGQAEDCRMRFRIGIHLGDVIEKADGTIYGDGVNTAARLESLADAGGVSVSDTVECAVRHRVQARFEDLGEKTLKNLAKPVRAYRMHRALPAPAAPAAMPPEPGYKPAIAVLPLESVEEGYLRWILAETATSAASGSAANS